jgi:hypothetical protein
VSENFINPKVFLRLTLGQRLRHSLLLFGLPLTVWECLDLFRELRHKPSLGTLGLVSGLLLAVLYGLVAAGVLAILEHSLLVSIRRKRGAP